MYGGLVAAATNSSDGNILIGDSTSYDSSEAALWTVLQQWNSPIDYATRIADLRDSGSNSLGVSFEQGDCGQR